MLFKKAPYAEFVCPPIQNAARKHFLKKGIKPSAESIPRKWFLKKEMTAFGNMPNMLIINLPNNRKIVLEEKMALFEKAARR